MPVRDRNIAWKTKREFIQARSFSGLQDATGTQTSLGAGTPVMGEAVAASQLSGLVVNAAGNEVFHLWPIPRDMDRKEPFRARYHFIHTSADADAPVFKTHYKAIAKLEAMSAANSTPDEELTHDAHTVATAVNSYEVTDWKKSVSHTKLTSSDIAILFCFEADALGGASASEINILGVELEYVVEATAQQREFTANAPVGGA
jgi:hypothetical protein